jgi:uncharacterized protein YcfJ
LGAQVIFLPLLTFTGVEMNSSLKTALFMATVAVATHASAQVTFFERENFEGRSFNAARQVPDLNRAGFNDRASSMVVVGGRWEICDDAGFSGRCVIVRPGRYASLSSMALNDRVSSVRAVTENVRVEDNRYAPASVASQIVFYEDEGFQGRTFTADKPVADFSRVGFNDRASSVVVVGDRWEVCADSRYAGQCKVLRPGSYASLGAMGMNDRVSSVRAVGWNLRVDEERFAPAPVAIYDSRRRNQERLFEANVTSVRAVVGPVEKRCWMERENVPQDQGNANVGGAVVGALIGGILGHQVGGGTGRDLATVGGAVAGAAVGSNLARNSATPGGSTREVQRCAEQPTHTRPEYWDVGYNFRGQDHSVQMTTAPGATVTVNAQGEPRT